MVRRSPRSSQPGEIREGCRHSGYYSGVGFYSKDQQQLRYVLVCDDCGEEMEHISTLDYTPQPVITAG